MSAQVIVAALSDGGIEPQTDQDAIARLAATLGQSRSPLGPFETWPPALKVAFRMIAASRFPMFITWGDDFPYLYNAACIPIVGARHPDGFGRPFKALWPEVWDDLSPLLTAAMRGTTSYREKLPLQLLRGGKQVSTWFTFSYSPLFDEDGSVRGVLSVAMEDTDRVIAERRQRFRQALDDQLLVATDSEAMAMAATTALRDHLGVDRCIISSVDAEALAGSPELAALSAIERTELARGEAVMRSSAPASLTVPQMRGEKIAAFVQAKTSIARDWDSEDVSVMREAIDRTRAATRRARAELAVRKTGEELRLLADSLPALISYVDANERYQYGNRAYEAWFGLAGKDLVGKRITEVVGQPAHARLKPAFERALAGESGVMEVRIPGADGTERDVQITFVPRCEGTGAVLGHYSLVQDIGHQKRAEAALRQSERRLNEVLESVSDGFFALSDDWRFTVFNRACEVAFAANRSIVLGKNIWEVFPATHRTEFEDRLRAVARTQEPDNFETTSIAGPGRAFEVRAAPKDSGGVAVAFSDVTDRKRAEDHRQLLTNELNHRVKNTLAVVQSIAAQSFKIDGSIVAARQAFDGRLATLASAHALLTAQNWENACLADVIESAIKVCAERSRFTVAGPPIALIPQTAVSLALAMHELCTNALKYGGLSAPSGHVKISWRIEPADDGAQRLRFLWAETGGPPVVVPARRGFGSRLLELGLARELNGKVDLDFDADGLKCRIDAPLPVIH